MQNDDGLIKIWRLPVPLGGPVGCEFERCRDELESAAEKYTDGEMLRGMCLRLQCNLAWR